MTLVAYILIVLLVCFSLRRLLWVVASWSGARRPGEGDFRPVVLVVVAFRNEQTSLPRLLACLDALDYPRERLSICLVDDASSDLSRGIAEAWARHRDQVRLLPLDANVGKADALNRALASAAGRPEIVVVYDADQSPHPASLGRLVEPFADPRVEAAGGYRQPVTRKPNAIAAYACLEAWTHQLVSLEAKEALGLDPPTMGGNCAYRRSALERIGGFPGGAFSEDIEVSMALAGTGGKTRFVRSAVADHAAASTFREFYDQRLRWSRGLMISRRRVRGLEDAFVVAGYFDRAVLVAVAGFVAFDHASPWWLIAYAAPALATVVTAMIRARPAPGLAAMLLATCPAMFAVDLAVSVWTALRGLSGRGIRWKAQADATVSPES